MIRHKGKAVYCEDSHKPGAFHVYVDSPLRCAAVGFTREMIAEHFPNAVEDPTASQRWEAQWEQERS